MVSQAGHGRRSTRRRCSRCFIACSTASTRSWASTCGISRTSPPPPVSCAPTATRRVCSRGSAGPRPPPICCANDGVTVAEGPSAVAPLGGREYLGYAAGEVANNLTFSMVSAFLLIYYTDVAGISAATAGTLFLVARIWGGATDLFAGHRVDDTSTRWGRFRPYLLFGSVPLLVTLVAVFSIPGGLSDDAKIAWAFGSYAMFQLAYSFVNIPYGSLSAAMTQQPDERSRLSAGRVVAASLTILLVAVVVSPQVSGSSDLQRSLTITTVVFALIGFALYLWCFVTAQETVQRGGQKVSVRQTIDMM